MYQWSQTLHMSLKHSHGGIFAGKPWPDPAEKNLGKLAGNKFTKTTEQKAIGCFMPHMIQDPQKITYLALLTCLPQAIFLLQNDLPASKKVGELRQSDQNITFMSEIFKLHF